MNLKTLLTTSIIVFLLFMQLTLAIPSLSTPTLAKNEKKPQVAIIIDDFGNKMHGSKQMIESLPIPITVAVMPFLASSKKDAKKAHELGLNVLIHLPMEAHNAPRNWLGPKAITTKLSDKEIKARLLAAYKELPFAIGINNHMGSKATEDMHVMRLVMEFCKENGLFFVDSATSSKSVAQKVAAEFGVTCLKNDLFLDDIHSSTHVAIKLGELNELALKKGDTIAIGHVGIGGRVMANSLSHIFDNVTKNDYPVQFVPITTLVKNAREKN